MKTQTLVLALLAAGAAAADTSTLARSTTTPSIALASNGDGTFTLTASLNVLWKQVRPADRLVDFGLTDWTIAPSVKLTSGGSLFSVSTSANGPATGTASFSGGLLFIRTGLPDLVHVRQSMRDIIDQAKKHAGALCATSCQAPQASGCAAFNEREQKGSDYQNHDASQFCEESKPIFKAQIAAVEEAVQAARNRQYRYPASDVSLWLGAGASKFNYYEQQGTAPDGSATFAAASSWHPVAGAAFIGTWLPGAGPSDDYGLTLEVPASIQYKFQDSDVSGTACKSVGTLAADGTPITSCAGALPVGPPGAGASLALDVAAGVIDRANGRWRLALDAGFARTTANSTNVWTFKLPFYLNALELGTTDIGASVVDYKGVIRVSPTVQYTPSSKGPSDWTFLITLDLLTQTSLFVRADTVLK